MFDFDREIDRRNDSSVKWRLIQELGYSQETLPLWVADMDFSTAPCVQEALHRAADHGIFGYSEATAEYKAAARRWFAERHGWTPEPDWLVTTPGVVFAISMAIQALTEPGDAILVQPPVYYPFYNMIEENGRTVVRNSLRLRDGRYEIDFADLEAKLRSGVKLFILCSPHNPVGRVWTREELRRVGELCLRCGVPLLSDEIHCDFAFAETPHTMLLDACPELQDRCLVCTAPSKSFNLAGLQASNIWIPSAELRERFRKVLSRCGYFGLNTMALEACRAAYEGGGDWLDACKAYLRGNLDFLRQFLQKKLPELRLIEPQGTYFAWVDCSALGLNDKELDRFLLEKAKLWLDGGSMFGPEGSGFQRFVLACTRKTLREALEQLEAAIRSR